jgi:hypothetical protein
MNSNNCYISDIKQRLERFARKTRRNEQLEFFKTSRQSFISQQTLTCQSSTAIGKAQVLVLTSLFNDNEEKDCLDFFTSAKNYLIDAHESANDQLLLKLLFKIRCKLAENIPTQRDSLKAFFESELPKVIFQILRSSKKMKEDYLMTEMMWILGYSTTSLTDHVNLLISLGMLDLIVEILPLTNISLVEPSILVIGNIIGRNSLIKDEILKKNLLQTILPSLRNMSKNSKLVKTICWFLYNMQIHSNPDSKALVN